MKNIFENNIVRRVSLVTLGSLIICGIARFHVTQSSKEFIFQTDEIRKIEGCHNILVLGAKVNERGEMSTILKERAMAVVDLHKNGNVCKVLISGDKHKNGNVEYDEIKPVEEFLVQQGIDREMILLDGKGFDTLLSMKNVRDKFEWKDVLIVTQDFHLSRAVYIGRRMGLNAHGFVAYKFPYPTRSEKWKDHSREWPAAVKAVIRSGE